MIVVPFSPRRLIFLTVLLVGAASVWHFHALLHTAWTLVSLPLFWASGTTAFYISEERDAFDLTFANYTDSQLTAGDGYTDLVPPVMHHIMLGSGEMRPKWAEARQSCLDWHPGWKDHLWTDENAGKFIADKFPDFKPTWDAYKLPIQRIDALRYMVLYEYGGLVLDMDLKCRRSLGPLRRFGFVVPAAHPTGFSISFMMASKGNEFIGTLIDALKVYNRNWFGLPYVTVMFSTGGHMASAVHVLQPNRDDYRVLAGPPGNFTLHTLNGPVTTPILQHLGSSSWHSYDGLLIMSLGKQIKWVIFFVVMCVTCVTLFVTDLPRRLLRRWRRSSTTVDDDLEKRAA